MKIKEENYLKNFVLSQRFWHSRTQRQLEAIDDVSDLTERMEKGLKKRKNRKEVEKFILDNEK